mmetsp:Transcript_19087/g.38820  ORF Transcript_19087/g.38820 Transcript_19087/m.38820 type:complete len:85 (+) Transcript_19087:514-768(+)
MEGMAARQCGCQLSRTKHFQTNRARTQIILVLLIVPCRYYRDLVIFALQLGVLLAAPSLHARFYVFNRCGKRVPCSLRDIIIPD